MPSARAPDPILAQLFPARPSAGDLKKFRLIEAAIEVIAAHGLQAVTFEAIGARVGASRSNVLYHFPDLERLVEGAVQYITAAAQQITIERIRTQPDWRGQVRAYVEGAFEWYERHPGQAAVMMAFYHLCTFRKPFRELHLRIRATGAARLAAVLEPQLGAAALETAMIVQSVLSGQLVELFTCRGPAAAAEYRDRAVRAAFGIIDSAAATRPRRSGASRKGRRARP